MADVAYALLVRHKTSRGAWSWVGRNGMGIKDWINRKLWGDRNEVAGETHRWHVCGWRTRLVKVVRRSPSQMKGTDR